MRGGATLEWLVCVGSELGKLRVVQGLVACVIAASQNRFEVLGKGPLTILLQEVDQVIH
jgi:hypothetical protein